MSLRGMSLRGMSLRGNLARAGAGVLLLAACASPAGAQQQKSAPPAQAAPAQAAPAQAAANPGKDLVASKCFQCHTDAMFRDGRQDRRAWEGAIYRMVGRGGLWTAEEIKLMADYLGDALGPNAPRETKKQ